MKSGANTGDYVKVVLVKKEYEGVLLENPEPGIVLLKLDSGYNTGFNKKDVLEMKVVKKFVDEKEEVEVKKDVGKPNIAMIFTGGTIGARMNPKKGGVDWLQPG